MMRLEDLKEQIQERYKDTWVKIQESSTFISFKEKYDNLTPRSQKLFKMGLVFCGFGFVFWIMWGLFSTSSEKLKEFDEYRNTIQEIAKLKREMVTAPQNNPPPAPSSLKQQVDLILQSFYLNPQQIEQVSFGDVTRESLVRPRGRNNKKGSSSKSNLKQRGILVSLKTLNVKQMTDIAFRLQTIHEAVKLIGLDMKNSDGYTNYYDVMFTVVGFYPPMPPNTKNGLSKNNKK